MTKAKFVGYETVRQSGMTNMFDIRQVVQIAKAMTGVTLTREDCVEIMKNYSELHRLYSQPVAKK